MNPGSEKLPLWERRQVHEEPRTDQVVRTITVFGTSTVETVAARWAGAPGVGDAELVSEIGEAKVPDESMA